MTPNESPLDREVLDENAELGMDGLRELVDMYLVQANQIMQDLHTSVHSGVNQDVNELAHKLAGSSVVCGVSVMVPPLRTLEKMARDGNLSGAEPVLADASAALETAERLLAEYMAEHA